MKSKYVFKQAQESDFSVIEKIFDQAPDYFMKVEGKLSQPEKVPQEFESRPKHLPLSNKRTYIIFENTNPMGYLDAILGHPTPESACIALFLLIENFQGRGVGKDVYRQWEKMFVEHYKPKFIRLWVAETNDVMGFWKKQGFVYEGVIKDYKAATRTLKTYELDKFF